MESSRTLAIFEAEKNWLKNYWHSVMSLAARQIRWKKSAPPVSSLYDTVENACLRELAKSQS